MSGSEARRPAPTTNSTRVASATDLAKQGRRPHAVGARGLGLRPEGVLVYAERSQGQAASPTENGSRTRQIGRTLESKTMPSHSKSLQSAKPQTKIGAAGRYDVRTGKFTN